MSNITLRIYAQVEENYNHRNNDPSDDRWKPKGGQYFEGTIDGDLLLYSEEEELIDTINSILLNESNRHVRYTYVSYEPIFHDVIDIGDIGRSMLTWGLSKLTNVKTQE